jgi:hypothetical protein
MRGEGSMQKMPKALEMRGEGSAADPTKERSSRIGIYR